jgi:hypothetical protein
VLAKSVGWVLDSCYRHFPDVLLSSLRHKPSNTYCGGLNISDICTPHLPHRLTRRLCVWKKRRTLEDPKKWANPKIDLETQLRSGDVSIFWGTMQSLYKHASPVEKFPCAFRASITLRDLMERKPLKPRATRVSPPPATVRASPLPVAATSVGGGDVHVSSKRKFEGTDPPDIRELGQKPLDPRDSRL